MNHQPSHKITKTHNQSNNPSHFQPSPTTIRARKKTKRETIPHKLEKMRRKSRKGRRKKTRRRKKKSRAVQTLSHSSLSQPSVRNSTNSPHHTLLSSSKSSKMERCRNRSPIVLQSSSRTC
jgi:hypothetical protein